MSLFAILLLGALGTFTRYAVGTLSVLGAGFPWTTLSVNMLGSFLVGFIYAWPLAQGRPWTQWVIIGFLGALTTYSAFVLDALKLVQKGQWTVAALYMGSTYVITFCLCVLGFWLGQKFS